MQRKLQKDLKWRKCKRKMTNSSDAYFSWQIYSYSVKKRMFRKASVSLFYRLLIYTRLARAEGSLLLLGWVFCLFFAGVFRPEILWNQTISAKLDHNIFCLVVFLLACHFLLVHFFNVSNANSFNNNCSGFFFILHLRHGIPSLQLNILTLSEITLHLVASRITENTETGMLCIFQWPWDWKLNVV